MRNIAGMSVIITGAGSGLGAGLARHLVSRKARITISGRRADRLEALAKELGPLCRAVVGDVTKDADRRKLLAAALEHGGGLDVLVNNAGNMLRGPIETIEEGPLLELFNTNVVGAMMMTGLATEHLAKSKGSIVFMGSVHTRRSFPGVSPYAATKAATETAARVLAAELGARQIRVNCVIPGAVPTELNIRAGVLTAEQQKVRFANIAREHVLGRVGTEQEVAESIEYLICADWVTGSTLIVDGGLSLGATTA